MPQFSQTIVSLKLAVLRGITRPGHGKLPKAKSCTAKHLTNAPWLALDPNVWPCQISTEMPTVRAAHDALLSTGSTDSSPASSAAPSIFSQDNNSTSTVDTIPSPIPSIITSDYDAEKAGRRSDVEWEYKDMFLGGKGVNTKVRQLSGSDANSLAPRDDPMTLGFLAPPGAFPVLNRTQRVVPKRTVDIWGHADVCSHSQTYHSRS